MREGGFEPPTALLDAGDRFELPIVMAYEASLVTGPYLLYVILLTCEKSSTFQKCSFELL